MTPSRTPKVPNAPTGPLTHLATDIVTCDQVLWRIAMTTSQHSLSWNDLRSHGPVDSMRWDPQYPPPSTQEDRAVMYAAVDISTSIAEVFQKYRAVDPVTDTPYLYGFAPTRALRLLDLTGSWAVRNHAAAALTSADRKDVTRAWSAAILDAWPKLDGLWTPSTWAGKPMVVLYPHARNAFPRSPQFSRPLTHPDTYRTRIRPAAKDVGYAAPDF